MWFIWTILALIVSFIIACLVRKCASHTLLNGFMSKEQADDVFPEWQKQKKNGKR